MATRGIGRVTEGGDSYSDPFDIEEIRRILESMQAGFSVYGPSGTANQEFKTLKAYLRTVFGPLPEGAVDYASGDLNGDGTNELYAVDADGNPHTVYSGGMDNPVSVLFEDWDGTVDVQYGDPGGAGTGSDDGGAGTGPLTDDEGNLLVDENGNLIFNPIVPGVTIPTFPLPNDGGGGGGGGSSGGGGSGGGSDPNDTDDTDTTSTGTGTGTPPGGSGQPGDDKSQQYYEVDEDGNVFILVPSREGDESSGWDEDGFWQGEWRELGNINDGTGAWWEEFLPGKSYGEHGEEIITPDDTDVLGTDDDDDDDLFGTISSLLGNMQGTIDGTDPDFGIDDILTGMQGTVGGGGDDNTGGGGDGGTGGSGNGGDGASEGNTIKGNDGGTLPTGGPQPPTTTTTPTTTQTVTPTTTTLPTGGPQPPGGGGGGSGGGSGGGDGGGDGDGDGDGDGSGSPSTPKAPELDVDKYQTSLFFNVPELYRISRANRDYISDFSQSDSSLLMDDFFNRNTRRNGMLV